MQKLPTQSLYHSIPKETSTNETHVEKPEATNLHEEIKFNNNYKKIGTSYKSNFPEIISRLLESF